MAPPTRESGLWILCPEAQASLVYKAGSESH